MEGFILHIIDGTEGWVTWLQSSWSSNHLKFIPFQPESLIPNWPFADDSSTYRAEDSDIPTPNTSGRLPVCLHLLPLAFLQLNRFALGGWWVRPSNWATNTAVVATGILAITYGVWNVSSKYEVCPNYLSLPLSPHSSRPQSLRSSSSTFGFFFFCLSCY